MDIIMFNIDMTSYRIKKWHIEIAYLVKKLYEAMII